MAPSNAWNSCAASWVSPFLNAPSVNFIMLPLWDVLLISPAPDCVTDRARTAFRSASRWSVSRRFRSPGGLSVPFPYLKRKLLFCIVDPSRHSMARKLLVFSRKRRYELMRLYDRRRNALNQRSGRHTRGKDARSAGRNIDFIPRDGRRERPLISTAYSAIAPRFLRNHSLVSRFALSPARIPSHYRLAPHRLFAAASKHAPPAPIFRPVPSPSMNGITGLSGQLVFFRHHIFRRPRRCIFHIHTTAFSLHLRPFTEYDTNFWQLDGI